MKTTRKTLGVLLALALCLGLLPAVSLAEVADSWDISLNKTLDKVYDGEPVQVSLNTDISGTYTQSGQSSGDPIGGYYGKYWIVQWLDADENEVAGTSVDVAGGDTVFNGPVDAGTYTFQIINILESNVNAGATLMFSKQFTISPASHTHALTHTEATEATCTDDGNIEYWYCDECGKYFSDEAATTEITQADAVIAALGHTPADPIQENVTEAACETEGSYEAVTYCSVCGEELSREESAIPALGHDWGAWTVVTAATETTAGLRQRVCSHDDSHIERETIPATGGSSDDSDDDYDYDYDDDNGGQTAGSTTSTTENTDNTSSTDTTETTDAATVFEDVEPEAYYVEAVSWAVTNGVTNGTSETTFSPDATVTRAQAVTFLWRALGSPEPTADNPFGDVAENDYYYKAVLWAAEMGITNGTGDGAFSPADNCSRDHIITFLWRALGQPSGTSAAAWYEDATAWAESIALLDGTAIPFAHGDDCPRADVVTYLYRLLAA